MIGGASFDLLSNMLAEAWHNCRRCGMHGNNDWCIEAELMSLRWLLTPARLTTKRQYRYPKAVCSLHAAAYLGTLGPLASVCRRCRKLQITYLLYCCTEVRTELTILLSRVADLRPVWLMWLLQWLNCWD